MNELSLVSKNTVVLHRWESETANFGIKQGEKGQISTPEIKWRRSFALTKG